VLDTIKKTTKKGGGRVVSANIDECVRLRGKTQRDVSRRVCSRLAGRRYKGLTNAEPPIPARIRAVSGGAPGDEISSRPPSRNKALGLRSNGSWREGKLTGVPVRETKRGSKEADYQETL